MKTVLSQAMTPNEFHIRVIPLKDRIYRLAKSMLADADEAEDATQDILEKLWLRRDSLAGYSNLEAFVYSSARNHCIDRIRRRKTRYGAAGELAHTEERSSDSARGIEMRDMKAIVEKLIADLPDKQRETIYLRDVEGCEFAEIAELTGADEPTVRVTLSRARKTVRERMLKIMNYGT